MNHYYQSIGENWFTFPNLYTNMVQKYPKGNFLEIGSWKGRSACFIAVEIYNSAKDIKLFCVDTWKGSDEHTDLAEIKNDELYDIFTKNIEPVKNIIIPIRKSSLDAVVDFPDEYFDFIFIDASHDYDNVSKDIRAWFPKLKKNGFFAGHDYRNGWSGVEKAVDDWVNEKGLKLEIQGSEYVWGLTKK